MTTNRVWSSFKWTYMFYLCLWMNTRVHPSSSVTMGKSKMLFVLSGHQCLRSGERHRPRAISDQWALLWIGQCEYCQILSFISGSHFQNTGVIFQNKLPQDTSESPSLLVRLAHVFTLVCESVDHLGQCCVLLSWHLHKTTPHAIIITQEIT